MNIQELKSEKTKIEKEINDFINKKLNEFIKITDVYIDSIDVSLTKIDQLGSDKPYCYYAETKLRIEL